MVKLNLEADQVMRLSCQGMGRGDWMGGVFPGSGVPKKVEWGCAAHFPKPSPYWGIPFFICTNPTPTSWKAAYDTGPVRIFFQRKTRF